MGQTVARGRCINERLIDGLPSPVVAGIKSEMTLVTGSDPELQFLADNGRTASKSIRPRAIVDTTAVADDHQRPTRPGYTDDRND